MLGGAEASPALSYRSFSTSGMLVEGWGWWDGLAAASLLPRRVLTMTEFGRSGVFGGPADLCQRAIARRSIKEQVCSNDVLWAKRW